MHTIPVVASRLFVDGAWRTPAERLGVLHDPNTGLERVEQLGATPHDVEDALRAADRLHASQTLDRMPAASRAAVLESWADALDLRAEDIAVQDAISNGNPITTTRVLASFLGDRVRSAARQATQIGDGLVLPADGRTVRLLNRALGPTLVLAPWNAPTFVAVSKLSTTIGSGSPVILKPSEWTPGGAQIAFELLQAALDQHGFPAATAQLVHGAAAVGSALAGDARVRAISFTGGLAAGRAVARAAAETLAVVQLELGSNNPAIVLADADVERTAEMLVAGVTRLNGQWCEAPGKVLVPPALHDPLVDALSARAGELQIDHSFEAGTQLGPLAYRAHRDRLEAQLAAYAEAGATVRRVGMAPDLDGWFFRPALVTGLGAADAPDELFGPALTIHAVESVDEAVQAANLPGGGLDGFVFGEDEEAALEVGARIRAGEVRVNGTYMADLADGSEQTFWGTAGVGGHDPAHGVAFSQGRRVVGVDAANLPI
ncbi:phenylacetaldehyde dehydrogenase [Microbacterium thalassium]|nr:phenylacetaldehyde dehydrogenase [Microbacterium thalassium]